MVTRADGRPRRPAGNRLADPRDPAAIDALTRPCPTCLAETGHWCKGQRTGYTLTRIHAARARFHDTVQHPEGKPTR